MTDLLVRPCWGLAFSVAAWPKKRQHAEAKTWGRQLFYEMLRDAYLKGFIDSTDMLVLQKGQK